METKTKQWADGSSVTIQYNGQGDGQIIITSDPNEHYEARSMQITVEITDGSGIQRAININQAAKQRIDLSAAVVTAANQTYSGSAKTPTPTVTLNGSTVPSTGYDVSYNNNTNAGTATITITGKGDYTGTATGTFTIAKATPSYTAPSRKTGLTYNGSSQYLTTTGSTSHGTIYYSTDGVNWYTSRRTGTNAGTYHNYWKLVGDTNHTDVNSIQLSDTTIAKASRSIYWSLYPSTLNEGDSGSLSAYVSAGSGDGSISFSSSNSSVASISGSTIYGVSEGSCTIYANISEGTNYKSASTSYTIEVEPDISWLIDNLISAYGNQDYSAFENFARTLGAGKANSIWSKIKFLWTPCMAPNGQTSANGYEIISDSSFGAKGINEYMRGDCPVNLGGDFGTVSLSSSISDYNLSAFGIVTQSTRVRLGSSSGIFASLNGKGFVWQKNDITLYDNLSTYNDGFTRPASFAYSCNQNSTRRIYINGNYNRNAVAYGSGNYVSSVSLGGNQWCCTSIFAVVDGLTASEASTVSSALETFIYEFGLLN